MAQRRKKKHYSTKEQCISAGGFSEKSVHESDHVRLEYEMQHIDIYKAAGCPLPSDDDVSFIRPNFDLFHLMPVPKSDDWLACHNEIGQSFRVYSNAARNCISKQRDKIYVLPLYFDESPVPQEILEALAAFASIFFACKTSVMKATKVKVETRINEYTESLQAHAGEILTALQRMVPKDAFAVGAVTACDLYPRDSWNFVFGLASLSSGVGVYSLARYLPSFPSSFQASDLPPKGNEEWAQLLKRTCRVMVHEMGHMFGLKHCIFYRCLMNGSNHFEESEGRPLGLCPVCLRKLHFACRFTSLRQRFEQLQEFCEAYGLREEAAWFQKRLGQ